MSFSWKTFLLKIHFFTAPSPKRSLLHNSKHNNLFISSSLLSTSFAWYLNASVTALTVKAMASVSKWRWSSYLFSIYFRRSFFTQTCHGCCLFFILTNKRQWIEDNKFRLKGLCHACLVTITYNGSFFTRERDICKELFFVNDKNKAMHQTSISPKTLYQML